jgi:acyl transferase domain-containing protein
LQGESPGVFVGISYNEYAQLSAAASTAVSTYTATGGSLSVAAGMCMEYVQNCLNLCNTFFV